MPNIDSLLSRRHTHRIGKRGKRDVALARIDLSRSLAAHFTAFDPLRNHLFHPHDGHVLAEHTASAAKPIIDMLHDRGWIVPVSGRTWKPTNIEDSRTYLSGGWLEELAFCAHEAAGVDEASFGQKVEWTVKGVMGRNEIDVIARRGEVLSFTSCKTIQPQPSDGKNNTLRGFLTETDYWNIHFADDQGRALLIVTADIYDEMRRNALRYPSLMARASILDVSMVGLEELRWERLVERIQEHWQKSS